MSCGDGECAFGLADCLRSSPPLGQLPLFRSRQSASRSRSRCRAPRCLSSCSLLRILGSFSGFALSLYSGL
eukprot:883504-Pleurochrysis_carterae.AAC.1